MEKGLQFVNLTSEGRTKTNEYHFQRIQFEEVLCKYYNRILWKWDPMIGSEFYEPGHVPSRLANHFIK